MFRVELMAIKAESKFHGHENCIARTDSNQPRPPDGSALKNAVEPWMDKDGCIDGLLDYWMEVRLPDVQLSNNPVIHQSNFIRFIHVMDRTRKANVVTAIRQMSYSRFDCFRLFLCHSTIRTMLLCLRGRSRTAKAREGPRFCVTNSEFPVN
jgi:hypothetical protein